MRFGRRDSSIGDADQDVDGGRGSRLGPVGDISFPFSYKEMLEEGWEKKCSQESLLASGVDYDERLFVGSYQTFVFYLGAPILKKHLGELFLLRCLYAPRSAVDWFLKIPSLRSEVLTDAYLETLTRFETLDWVAALLCIPPTAKAAASCLD